MNCLLLVIISYCLILVIIYCLVLFIVCVHIGHPAVSKPKAVSNLYIIIHCVVLKNNDGMLYHFFLAIAMKSKKYKYSYSDFMASDGFS